MAALCVACRKPNEAHCNMHHRLHGQDLKNMYLEVYDLLPRDEDFICTMCYFRLYDTYTFKTQYLATQLRGKVTNDGKVLKCKHCHFEASNESTLASHRLSHKKPRRMQLDKELRRFCCDTCGYKAKTKCVLQKHMTVHSDIKKFSCPKCQYKTKRHSSLTRHIFKHEEVKRFACPTCEYATHWKGDLKQHMSKKHQDKAT